jgi:hypothetical protein
MRRVGPDPVPGDNSSHAHRLLSHAMGRCLIPHSGKAKGDMTEGPVRGRKSPTLWLSRGPTRVTAAVHPSSSRGTGGRLRHGPRPLLFTL